MFTHPDQIAQLAAEHQRQMLADASQWNQWHQKRRQPSKRLSAAAIIRRMAEAIAEASVAAAKIPSGAWPARRHAHRLARNQR